MTLLQSLAWFHAASRASGSCDKADGSKAAGLEAQTRDAAPAIGDSHTCSGAHPAARFWHQSSYASKPVLRLGQAHLKAQCVDSPTCLLHDTIKDPKPQHRIWAQQLRKSSDDEASEAPSARRKEEDDINLEEDGEDNEQQQGQHHDIKKSSKVKSKSKKPRLIF